MKRSQARRRSSSDIISDAITAFSGSFTFVILHITWFAGWIVVNLIPALAFDPFPFGLLTLIVSLEAIFLSTFVLMSQNRTTKRDEAQAREDFLTNARSQAWVELIGEKLGIDHSDVNRHVSRIMRSGEKNIRRDG